VLGVSALVASSALLEAYLLISGFQEGGSRSVCAPTRVGTYILEAYVMPATPISGEEAQIIVTVQGSRPSLSGMKLTIIVLKPLTFSAVLGPEPIPLGARTWSLRLAEGVYEVALYIAGPEGAGVVWGRIQVVSSADASKYSAIRFISSTVLWLGVPVLVALLVTSKARWGSDGSGGDKP